MSDSAGKGDKIGQPLVSVAMATYNGENFLREQLDTIFAQTYSNIEVIVCDDCSTDGTHDILRSYAATNRLCFLVNERRLGVKENFAKAASLCTGTYIAFSDQDDVWLPTRIQALLEQLGEAMLVYGPALEFLDENNEKHLVPDMNYYQRFCREASQDELTAWLATSNWIAGHQMLFRRKLLASALPIPSSQVHHDAWFALMSSIVGRVVFASDGKMYYRRHFSSVTYTGHQSIQGGLKAKLRSIGVDTISITLEIDRLISVLAISQLSAPMRRRITDLIFCHRCRMLSGLHFSGLLKAIYYLKRYYGMRSIYSRSIFLAQVLFGINLQRVIWYLGANSTLITRR